MKDTWNKCEVCGRFIPYSDIDKGAAIHRELEPSSHFGPEKWETLCKLHVGIAAIVGRF